MSIEVKSSSSSHGIGFVGLLTIVFVVAKLWGVIDWSWWLVFSPVIFTVVFVVLLYAVLLWVATR